MRSIRRHRLLTSLAAGAGAMMLLAGCAAGPSVPATGETTEVTVRVEGMSYVPDVIDVPVGDELVITFENTGTDTHDLVLDNGVRSQRLAPGQSQVIEVGVISGDMDGWCAVSNHRAMGMELVIRAITN